MPHKSYEGKDAQLEAALKEVQEETQADRRPVPRAPPHPDKSSKYRQ